MKWFILLFPLTLMANPLIRLSKGIQFPTVSQEKGINEKVFKEYLAFLKKSYPETFRQLEVKEFSHTRLLTWKGRDTNAPVSLFNAHYDVVPVEDKDLTKWEHPPFSGAIESDQLWGRGSMDDKVSVHALLETIEELLNLKFQPQGTLHFALTHDEELGGWQGAYQVAEYLKDKKIDAVYDEGLVIIRDVLPDFLKPVALIGVGEKGYLTLKITVTKNGGHSSMPADETAITVLNKALLKINKNFFKRKLGPTQASFLKILGEKSTGIKGFVLRHPEVFDSYLISQLQKSRASDALLRTTAAVTVLRAGIKENKIPHTAEALINFRLIQGDTVEKVFKKVKKKFKNPEIKVEILNPKDAVNPSRLASTKTEGYQKLKTAIQATFSDTLVAPNLMVARTDSYHYQNLTPNIYRFIPLVLKKEETNRIHGLNERISLVNYGQILTFYRNFLKNL